MRNVNKASETATVWHDWFLALKNKYLEVRDDWYLRPWIWFVEQPILIARFLLLTFWHILQRIPLRVAFSAFLMGMSAINLYTLGVPDQQAGGLVAVERYLGVAPMGTVVTLGVVGWLMMLRVRAWQLAAGASVIVIYALCVAAATLEGVISIQGFLAAWYLFGISAITMVAARQMLADGERDRIIAQAVREISALNAENRTLRHVVQSSVSEVKPHDGQ